MNDVQTNLEDAKAGYEAYAASRGNKTWDGREMPAWEDLGDIQGGWRAAAAAIAARASAR
jgi:hypothetical protein